MYLVSHGGQCCGIKTIFGFGNPSYVVNEQTFAQAQAAVKTCVYPYNRPSETLAERFKALVEYQTTRQQKGILEIVLIGSQLTRWRKIVEEVGFKETVSGMNTNSLNICTVFHYVYEPKPKVADPKAAASLRE